MSAREMRSGRTDKALDYGLKGLRFEPRPGSCELFLGRDPWWDFVSWGLNYEPSPKFISTYKFVSRLASELVFTILIFFQVCDRVPDYVRAEM